MRELLHFEMHRGRALDSGNVRDSQISNSRVTSDNA
jgi:hypothetical protein